MDAINYVSEKFSLSKTKALQASEAMGYTMNSASAVKSTIPSDFIGADSALSAVNAIFDVCVTKDSMTSTFDEWQALLNSLNTNGDELTIDSEAWGKLVSIYPDFENISEERRNIIILALTYLGQHDDDIDWLSGVWCAKFAGGIINDAMGMTVINNTGSVAKVLGLSGSTEGIAYTSDANYRYVLSEAYTDKYMKYDGNLIGWKTAIERFNSVNGRTLKGSDWIDEDFTPKPGDMIFFNKITDSRFSENVSETNGFPGSTITYSHIGLVLGTRTENGVTYVDTIEGNVSNTVAIKSYPIDSNYIVGYSDINYENISKGIAGKKVTEEESNSSDSPLKQDIPALSDIPSDSGDGTLSGALDNNNNLKDPGTGDKDYKDISDKLRDKLKADVEEPVEAEPVEEEPVVVPEEDDTPYVPPKKSEPYVPPKNPDPKPEPTPEPTPEPIVEPTYILPDNRFSESLPNITNGNLDSMEISMEHVNYELSGITDEIYNNYINSIKESGFTLGTDGSWISGNYTLNLVRNNTDLNIYFKLTE